MRIQLKCNQTLTTDVARVWFAEEKEVLSSKMEEHKTVDGGYITIAFDDNGKVQGVTVSSKDNIVL